MIPNIITSIRFITIFPLAFYIYNNGITNIWPFIIFMLIVITDSIDGYIARNYNMITEFGKAFDPIVDKTLFIVITIALLLRNIIPVYSLFIYIRDIIIAIFSLMYMVKSKKVIAATIWGKGKTVLHFAAIALVLLLGKWTIYSMILLSIGFITVIPECIERYRKWRSL